MRAILQHIHPAFHYFIVIAMLVFGVSWYLDEARAKELAEDMAIIQEAREQAPKWAREMFPDQDVYCLYNIEEIGVVVFGRPSRRVLVLGDDNYEIVGFNWDAGPAKGCVDAKGIDADLVWFLLDDKLVYVPDDL